MVLSCPLESHIINPLLTKLVRSRWLDIGLVLFFFSTTSRSINSQKRSWPISSHHDLTLTWSITQISCPLGTTRRVPQEKSPRKPYNKSFIDQICWARWLDIVLVLFFLRVYGPRLLLGQGTRKKKTWPLSSHLEITLCESWSIAQTNTYKREDPLVMHALCCQFIQLFWLQLEGGQFYAYLTAHAGLKRCSQNFAGFFNLPKLPKLERAL